MTIGRISLILSALVFGAFGFAFLLWPTAMAGLVDITLPTSTAIIDFQATYGGLEIGLAMFFAYCAATNRLIHLALLVQALSLGGLALGRIIGYCRLGRHSLDILALAGRAVWMCFGSICTEKGTASVRPTNVGRDATCRVSTPSSGN